MNKLKVQYIYLSMKTIIHDLKFLDKDYFNFTEDDVIINANDCQNSCIGCFSCWIKHPKICIYKDDFSNITEALKNSDELIIISKNRFGCYSESVKRVLERCIGYVLPYFTIRDKHIHHASRYDRKLKFTTYFYGEITDDDLECLYRLAKANSINLNARNYEVKILEDKVNNNVYTN